MLKKSLVSAGLLVYLVVSVSLLRLPDDVADWLTREDSLFEALGAAALLAASVFAVLTLRREKANGAHIVKLIALVGLALFLFVAAGEEISWGQRYLGIETPDAIARINAQGEINFHNLYSDDHGQNFSQTIYAIFWRGFGVALPLLALIPPVGRVLRRYLPIVPLWVAGLFVAQQLLSTTAKVIWRADPSQWNGTYRGHIGGPPFTVDTAEEAAQYGATGPAGLSEVMEANVQVLLLVAVIYLFIEAGRRARRSVDSTNVDWRPSPGGARRPPMVSRRRPGSLPSRMGAPGATGDPAAVHHRMRILRSEGGGPTIRS
jgi:hypothetical protein